MYKFLFIVLMALSFESAIGYDEIRCTRDITRPEISQIENMKTEIKAIPSYSKGYKLIYEGSRYMTATNKAEHYFFVENVNHVKYIVETNCKKAVTEIYIEFK